MSERKLASVQRILDIQPIEGADAIDVATINGWQVVVKKNEFKVGDLVVYFEIDSWIPETLAPFLVKGKEARVYEGIPGERLRTVRLRGTTSQGLILPLEYSPGLFIQAPEGDDVTELLGIVKYDPPMNAQLSGVARGNFPSMIPKTDEERIQNLTKHWDRMSQFSYEISEKLEGSSMTVALLDGEFNVCSRNLNLKETEGNTFWDVARRYDIENKMRTLACYQVAIQGELVGPGVEGNIYDLKQHDFYVYSVYDIVAGAYLSPEVRHNLCAALGLKHVPVIAHSANLSDTLGIATIADVLKFADGKSAVNPNKLREGLVFKRVDGQEHWKAISNQYLVKQK